MASGVAALRTFAGGRHGCFTTAEAGDCGVSARMLGAMLRRGEIERVHHSVYRFCVVPWTFAGRLAAAVLAGGPRACASHASAAHVLGLRDLPRGRPEITVARASGPPLAGVRVHRSRSLAPEDVTEVDGLPCTTGSRTLIDLAGRLASPRLVALVDEAICAQVASRSRLHDRASGLSRGRKGVRTLVEVTAPGAEGTFWSALERAFGGGVRAAGLPPPRYNRPIRLNGRTYFVDAVWEEQRLVVELYGLRFHATPAARGTDAERLNAFTMAGYRVLVFTWRDVVEDMARVAATVREALGGSGY